MQKDFKRKENNSEPYHLFKLGYNSEVKNKTVSFDPVIIDFDKLSQEYEEKLEKDPIAKSKTERKDNFNPELFSQIIKDHVHKYIEPSGEFHTDKVNIFLVLNDKNKDVLNSNLVFYGNMLTSLGQNFLRKTFQENSTTKKNQVIHNGVLDTVYFFDKGRKEDDVIYPEKDDKVWATTITKSDFEKIKNEIEKPTMIIYMNDKMI